MMGKLKNLMKELYENIKENIFIQPAVGIWIGYGGGEGKKNEKKESGKGYGILSDIAQYVKLGILGGGTIGYGKKFGIATGLIGGIALYPFLGYNFVGVPLTITYKRKWGIGIIIPVYQTEWYVAASVALAGFILGIIGAIRTEDYDKNKYRNK